MAMANQTELFFVQFLESQMLNISKCFIENAGRTYAHWIHLDHVV